ncbi:hypothetical protein DSO57_1031234 [Entomophthora muscae]|uniref:Uncharacterized protein n=1 Tax=Entomophthora muscae TaxID=34485 RepID=A0ACC2SDL9_9FUNG|nr:hypothetical protein DSO57_1031234 [Entomophthora muscae]
MVFNSNIFNCASSQASFNGGKAQNVEAPVYTQAFEVGNKEADLLLNPNPYGFDLFESHLASSSALAPTPTPAQAACKSLPPLALDRTIFPQCTKKSAPKPAKPLNSLEDLAHTLDEIFVLAYPSQAANVDVGNSFPTWEESLINLDYFSAWACPHLKLIRSNQPGRALVKSTKSFPTETNAIQKCPLGTSQSEVGSEIGEKPSKLPETTGKNSISSNQMTG